MNHIARMLVWLTLVVLASFVALLLHAGDPGRPSWWVEAAPIALWAAAPLVAPWLAARRWPRIAMSATIALAFVTAFAACAYVQAFFLSLSSTAALALLFVPLWQWAILIVIGAVALWRRRTAG